MAIEFNIGFNIGAPMPIDSRFTWPTLATLTNMAHPYEGLITYVEDQGAEYRYKAGAWLIYQPGGGGGGSSVWGSITGNLSDQVDLQNSLNSKLPLAGGALTGAVTSTSTITATNFITTG